MNVLGPDGEAVSNKVENETEDRRDRKTKLPGCDALPLRG